MLQLNIKNYKPIQIEIDGQVYEVKKVTNRVILRGVEISERLQQVGISVQESIDLTVDFLMLYLPIEKDWIIDNLSPEDCRLVMSNILEEMNKAMGAAEPPLASGPGGDKLPK